DYHCLIWHNNAWVF
nr:immunoglobulin light chain junction region [Macaca mulatta]MOY06803.1 immunoglobulin light chain junction region [Macaca mulatta]